MTPQSVWGQRAGIDNETAAELYRRALAASAADADAIWHLLGQQMIDDKVILPIVNPSLVLAYRSNVKGVRYSACCNLPLAELSRE